MFLFNDDEALAYIIQIKTQLKIFINSYSNNKEAIEKAQILYNQINMYSVAKNRENLNIKILDNISKNIEEFIESILKSI